MEEEHFGLLKDLSPLRDNLTRAVTLQEDHVRNNDLSKEWETHVPISNGSTHQQGGSTTLDYSDMNDEEMQFLSLVAYGFIGPLIIAIGLLGNGLTISTFLGKVPVWSNGATYTHLKWLALMDTGALVTAIPMEVRLSMPWRKLAYWEAFYQAHLELPVLNSFMGSSIFIVVCLTCMRFMALFQPAKFRNNTAGAGKQRKAQVAVLIAFSLAAALSAPLVMLKEVVCSEEEGACRAKENTDVTTLYVWKAFVVVSEGIVRVLPVVLLTVLNVAMIFKFRSVAQRRRVIISTRSNSRADAARAEERGKLILLSTIVLSFVCFNSPSAVLSIIYSESWENRRGFQVFRAISNDCELANFAVNFYAYFLCSKDFRQAFFASLPPCCEMGKCVLLLSRSPPHPDDAAVARTKGDDKSPAFPARRRRRRRLAHLGSRLLCGIMAGTAARTDADASNSTKGDDAGNVDNGLRLTQHLAAAGNEDTAPGNDEKIPVLIVGAGDEIPHMLATAADGNFQQRAAAGAIIPPIPFKKSVLSISDEIIHAV